MINQRGKRKTPSQKTLRAMFDQMSGPLVAQSSGHSKLTYPPPPPPDQSFRSEKTGQSSFGLHFFKGLSVGSCSEHEAAVVSPVQDLVNL